MTAFSAWLDGTAARVFAICATLFIVMNAGAIALVVAKKDRGLVNRWTARWLAANLALAGAGLGAPLAAKVVRLTFAAFSASKSLPLSADQESEQQQIRPAPPRR